MAIFVSDASSFQGEVSWDAASRVVHAGIEKVTQGHNYVNPRWAASKKEFLSLGSSKLTGGGYLFLDGLSTGAAQAQWFAKNAGNMTGLIIAVDMERVAPASPTIAIAKDCVRELRLLYPHHRIGGYAPKWFTGTDVLTFFDWTWASSYVPGKDKSPAALYEAVPNAWWHAYGLVRPLLLQFTDAGVVPGIPGFSDVSAFQEDSMDDLRLALIGQPAAVERTATGNFSLAETAARRSTTAEHIAEITGEMLTGSAGALAQFQKYAHAKGGYASIMPKGMRYYTSAGGGFAG